MSEQIKFAGLGFRKSSLGGIKAKTLFSNGFGASIVRSSFSYGGKNGLFEVAVLDEDGEIVYNTSITSDVVGHLTEEGVEEILNKISKL